LNGALLELHGAADLVDAAAVAGRAELAWSGVFVVVAVEAAFFFQLGFQHGNVGVAVVEIAFGRRSRSHGSLCTSRAGC
jgi:hypothetical protein